MRNASLKIYNKNKKRSEYNDNLDDKEIPVNIDFFDKMEYDSLLSIIDGLPETHREILFLYYKDELSTKEIAKLLDISESAVYKRIERSKKMLSDALVEGGYYE